MFAGFILAAALAAAAPGAAQSATPATMVQRDPAVFLRQLREMGYAVDATDQQGVIVRFTLHLSDRALGVVLGGCTENRNCTYLALSGVFTDVKDAPASWIEAQNKQFDLIKLWNREDGALAYTAAAVIEGMPRASFRSWLDLYLQSSNLLGQEASKAGLVK